MAGGRPQGSPLRKRYKRCNGRATARVAPTEGYKECLAGGRTEASAPTEVYLAVRRGGALPLPRAGKSAKRCQWQMKRAGFEEVPRLADTTVTGNRLARRWAREPRPYESVTRGARKTGRCGHRPLRRGRDVLSGGVLHVCFKFVKKLSCLFGAVAVQCFRRFFASKFALHPG